MSYVNMIRWNPTNDKSRKLFLEIELYQTSV